MFGTKKYQNTDKLTVQVHVVDSTEALQVGQKIWAENARTMHTDPNSGKEFLHFVYATPKCVVWMQREPGRNNLFELIVRWEDGVHEVYIVQGAQQPKGDDTRLKELLHSILTTPSVVLAKNAEG